jgi:hypothetical protein
LKFLFGLNLASPVIDLVFVIVGFSLLFCLLNFVMLARLAVGVGFLFVFLFYFSLANFL